MKTRHAGMLILLSLLTVGPAAAVAGDKGGGNKGGAKAGSDKVSGTKGSGKSDNDKAGGRTGGGDKSARRESGPSSAGGAKGRLDLNPRDTRSESQKNLDRNMQNAKEVSREREAAKEREAMRDKTHDGRLKVGDHTSVGGQTSPPGVNVRISTDPPKKEEKKNKPPR